MSPARWCVACAVLESPRQTPATGSVDDDPCCGTCGPRLAAQTGLPFVPYAAPTPERVPWRELPKPEKPLKATAPRSTPTPAAPRAKEKPMATAVAQPTPTPVPAAVPVKRAPIGRPRTIPDEIRNAVLAVDAKISNRVVGRRFNLSPTAVRKIRLEGGVRSVAAPIAPRPAPAAAPEPEPAVVNALRALARAALPLRGNGAVHKALLHPAVMEATGEPVGAPVSRRLWEVKLQDGSRVVAVFALADEAGEAIGKCFEAYLREDPGRADYINRGHVVSAKTMDARVWP